MSVSWVKQRRRTDPEYREALAQGKRKARRVADPTLVLRDVDRLLLSEQRAAVQFDTHIQVFRKHLDRLNRRADAHVDAYRKWKARRANAVTPASQRAYERAKTAWRRARRKGRLVSWCTIRDTLPLYQQAIALEATTGVEWDVDHRIPLKSPLASGLHCPANLQLLPRVLNEAKGAKYIT